jgi:hypothetical protein
MSAHEPASSGGTSEEAAEITRRLLQMIDDGEIDADTPQARRMVRRMEGAVAAWGKDDGLETTRPE